MAFELADAVRQTLAGSYGAEGFRGTLATAIRPFGADMDDPPARSGRPASRARRDERRRARAGPRGSAAHSPRQGHRRRDGADRQAGFDVQPPDRHERRRPAGCEGHGRPGDALRADLPGRSGRGTADLASGSAGSARSPRPRPPSSWPRAAPSRTRSRAARSERPDPEGERRPPMATSPARAPAVDVRRADDRFHPQGPGWTPTTASASAATTTLPTPTTGCCWSTTMTWCGPAPGSARTRTATWRSSHGCWTVSSSTRTPRGTRPHLSGPGPAHERRHRHLALGDEPVAATRRPLRADVGPARHRTVDPGYEQLDVNAELDTGRPGPHRLGPRPRCRHRHPPARRVLWGGRLPGETVAVPDARTSTCTSPGATPRWRAPAALETGDAARLTGAGRRLMADADGGAEVLVWETAGEPPGA